MRRHTSAVILLGGWVLLTPPYHMDKSNPPHFTWDKGSGSVSDQWDQDSAYDSARECEAARAQLNDDIDRRKSVSDEAHAFLKAVALGARCVPAEFVYPPKQRPRH
jgi:hypothetical protein